MSTKINESMRLVSKHGDGRHTAKVYKDNDWNEYHVKFYTDNKHVGEDADYHTDDVGDAKDTAESAIKKMGNSGSKVDEATGVTDFNPESQGGTRQELLDLLRKTKDSKYAEAARKAGASQTELQNAMKMESYSMDTLVDAIASQDETVAASAFNAIVSNKILDRFNEMKIEIAQNLGRK